MNFLTSNGSHQITTQWKNMIAVPSTKKGSLGGDVITPWIPYWDFWTWKLTKSLFWGTEMVHGLWSMFWSLCYPLISICLWVIELYMEFIGVALSQGSDQVQA